jgi:general stress protein 26
LNARVEAAAFIATLQAGLYIVDFNNIRGLMLLGTITIHNDIETKKAFWNDGDEMYYHLGVNDPDYCIMSFKSESGKYWENGKYIIDKNIIDEI